jgi:DNA-directed RNA polymerase specialized sigma24 family protein
MMTGKEKERYIISVMERYGISSKELYFVLQVFVLYVMLKHGVNFDEDIFQDAFVSVFEKVKYWDIKKGSLLSFLYSLIRDRVSYRKYLDARDVAREVSLLDCDQESLSFVVVPEILDYGSEMSRLRKSVLEEVLQGGDSVYRRAFLWRVMSEMV